MGWYILSTITISDLMKKLGNINLIDIRCSSSYNNNHIPGAKNIEYRTLLEDPSKYLDRNNKYYFYCQKGVQSHKLCSYLSSIGYDVVNVAGGYEAWILEK